MSRRRRLRIDHSLRRQFAEPGLWVFWRATAGSREKEGLVVTAVACDNRECPCREVHLSVVMANGLLSHVGFDAEGMFLGYDVTGGPVVPPERSLSAVVDYETGEVRADGDEGVDEDLLRWLQSEIDGEVLDRAYDVWLGAKGWCRNPAPQYGGWVRERGAMVGFGEAYPDARSDCYLEGGRRFLAMDQYCVEPGCSCGDVVVQFIEFVDERGRCVGLVRYDASAGRATSFESEPSCTDEFLRRLWGRYQARHSLPGRFQQRMARMKEAGAARGRLAAAARPAVPAVGRNDPCPCGSGRKYKKCCLGK